MHKWNKDGKDCVPGASMLLTVKVFVEGTRRAYILHVSTYDGGHINLIEEHSVNMPKA